MSFANANDGWAVGTDGTILATTKGGGDMDRTNLGHQPSPERRVVR